MSTKIPNIYLLLLVGKHLRRFEGRKRLQKIVFLLKEKYQIPFTYVFVPYLYGPYSAQLQKEIDLLSRNDYFKVQKINDLYEYEITPLGEKAAEEFEKPYGLERIEILKKRLQDLNELTTEELVEWSKQIMNERIKDNIFGK